MKDKIASALKKLGPAAPAAIAKELSSTASIVGYHLRLMEAGKAVKASGKGRGRMYALPDQEPGRIDAPPQQRKPARARKAKKLPAPLAAVAPGAAAVRFIPVVDAEKRLYIINSGEPLGFDEAQTLKIAELLFVHYEG